MLTYFHKLLVERESGFRFDSLVWELIKDYLLGDEHVRYWFALTYEQRRKSKVHPIILKHNRYVYVKSMEPPSDYNTVCIVYPSYSHIRKLMHFEDEFTERCCNPQDRRKRYVLRRKNVDYTDLGSCVRLWLFGEKYKDVVYVTYVD